MNYQLQLAGIERNPLDCSNLGGVTRQVECQDCGGVRLKLYACAVHGECALGKAPDDRTKSCDGCGDFKTAAHH